MQSMFIQGDGSVSRWRWLLAAVLMALYLIAAVSASSDVPLPLSILCNELAEAERWLDWYIAGCWML